MVTALVRNILCTSYMLTLWEVLRFLLLFNFCFKTRSVALASAKLEMLCSLGWPWTSTSLLLAWRPVSPSLVLLFDLGISCRLQVLLLWLTTFDNYKWWCSDCSEGRRTYLLGIKLPRPSREIGLGGDEDRSKMAGKQVDFICQQGADLLWYRLSELTQNLPEVVDFWGKAKGGFQKAKRGYWWQQLP